MEDAKYLYRVFLYAICHDVGQVGNDEFARIVYAPTPAREWSGGELNARYVVDGMHYAKRCSSVFVRDVCMYRVYIALSKL